MACSPFWWHQWGKWETYHNHYSILETGATWTQGVAVPPRAKAQDLRQRRRCETCGRVQDRLVAEGIYNDPTTGGTQ